MKTIKIVILASILVLIASAAFLPTLKNGFVSWDDDKYVTENPVLRHVSIDNLKQISANFFVGNYQPLTLLTYFLEYRFFGLDPRGYHLTNLVLHSFNCLFVFWLIWLLSGNIPAAFMTALLFGVHPLHVESVAWISERKDVLYAFFFLASIIFYCYYRTERRVGGYYYASLIFFLLSLMSKAMAITLPVVLLLVDYVYYGKPDKKTYFDKMPYFTLSVFFGVAAVAGQWSINALRSESYLDLAHKISIASYGIIFYLSKIVFPVNLSCLYPYADIKGIFPYAVSLAGCGLCAVAVVLSLRYSRKAMFCVGFFLVTLLPVLQFLPFGEAIVADRYVYIPMLGILYLIVEGTRYVYTRKSAYAKVVRMVLVFAAVAVSAIFFILTWNRCHVWTDGIALWNDVLSSYPDNAIAYNNRGVVWVSRGEYVKAHSDFVKALSIDPAFSDPYFNLGSLYFSQNNFRDAISFARKALATDPNYKPSYKLLMLLYGKTGRHKDVISVCEAAITLDPRDADIYAAMCSAYGHLGMFNPAIACGEKAVQVDPLSAGAHVNLAIAYFSVGVFEKAISHCDTALGLGARIPADFLESLKPHRITK